MNNPDEQQKPQRSFKDIKTTDWFYDAVAYVQQNGIFSGTDNDSFSPGGTMTRAMYVTVLGRMAGVDVSKYTTSAFADVQSDAYYAPYVQWAVEKGITKGKGNHKFSPDAAITREQMATLTLGFFESYKIPYQTNVSLTSKPKDLSDISPWAVDAIVKLWQAGLLTGDAKGNFNPRSQATRAEAAMFSMRSNQVVKAGANPNPTNPTTEPSKPTTGGGSSSTNPPSSPNPGNSLNTYTITFETNGGSTIPSLSLQQGKRLNNLPVPLKVGAIFQGWYKDSGLTQVLLNDDVVSGNMTLYAKYIDSVEEAVQSIPSITVLDQAPSFKIKVTDTTGSLTAEQVKAGIKFESPANPQFAGIEVTGSNGQFTVAAKGGAFEEGNTYRLTLTDTKLFFEGQDQTTTIYVFSIAKQEVVQLPLNAGMIYIPFSSISNMTRDGSLVASTSISVIAASVGNNGTDLGSANVTNGTFTYTASPSTGSPSIQVGDTVALYEGTRPDERTADTSDANNGDVAYVQITAIDGDTYTYTNADAKNVLVKPDVLPVSIHADTDGNATTITVNHIAMNFQDSKYAPLGLNELTVVNVGDFIAFYDGEFGSESTFKGYGLITSITSEDGMDVIEYSVATQEQITGALDFYQKQQIDGDQLLSEADVASLEGQIKQQAVESGFVQEAADYLSAVALQTDAFKQRYEVHALGAPAVKVSVENLTVVPSISDKLKHFPGYTGASVTLQVKADIVIDTDDGNDDAIVIHLTSTFVEELRFELGINGDTQIQWYWFIPIIKDYIITANLDAYTYTGITVTAEIGTMAKEKLKDSLVDWADAEDVENIATQIQALLDGVGDSGAITADTLRSKYQEILENETEWVPLLSKELVKKSARVCIGIIEIEFTVNLVISMNPNLTVGIDFNYKSAKRYSVTVRVLSGSGSSDTVSLSGDGEYQFKFYVLGTLGLRAGIQVELKAGILSVDLNSIGFEVEAGPYLKLWGYFYYELTNSSAGKKSKSLGALFMEMGIYLESAFVAQVGDGWLSAEVPIYENEWPLYSVGAQDNVYDFVYPQDDKLGVNLLGKVTSVQLPDKFFTMNVMDMKTGETSEKLFDQSKFTVEVDSPDFVYDPSTKKLKLKNSNTLGTTSNLTITWKSAPLAFTSAQIKRTIPLSFSAATFDWGLQLYFNNGDMPLSIVAQYNAKITVPADPVRTGYKFAGWYDDPQGGSIYTIPDRMPAVFKTLHARWTPNTDTPYKIEHYLIDSNDYSATLADTEKLTGITGTEIIHTSNKYVNQGYLPQTAPRGVYINGSGLTVVKLYYQRATRTITFKSGYGDQSVVRSLTLPIGKNMTWTPVVTRPGYTFTGWSPSVPSTVPNQDTTYTATWTAKSDTPYKIVHLLQDISTGAIGPSTLANSYTVVYEENKKGTTDAATITASTEKSYEGFTYDSNAPGTLLSSTIAGDGTTVLRLYYKRNSYPVTYDLNGGKVLDDSGPVVYTIPYGGRVMQPYVTNGTATFGGWTPSKPATMTMPAHALNFKAEWETGTYVVTHIRQDLTGGYTITESETLEGPTNNEVTATPKSYAGFTFDSSVLGTVATGIIKGPNDSPPQLKLYYKRAKFKEIYDANGGEFGTTTDGVVLVSYGASLSSATEPQVTKAGYIFKGWTPSKASTMPAHDVTYTAQWELGSTVSSVSINSSEPEVGNTLTANVVMSDSGSAGSRVTYQWQVETAAGSGTYQNATGTGNTTASYTVAAVDAGKKLRVVVTGVGEVSGTATSAATSAVPVPVTGVTVDNVNPTIGDILVASVAMGDGNPAGSRVTYQWKVETAVGSGSYLSATGTGNTTASYTVAAADVGKKLQVVVAGVSPVIGTQTATTSAVVVKVSSVSIDNVTPSVGDTLTANAVMSDSGAAGSRVTYQWQVETAAGSGTYQNATGTGSTTASYTVAAVDAGKKLQVVVTGVSPVTGTQSASTGAGTVSITSVTIDNPDPSVGTTINANVTLNDGNPAGSRVAYQWQVEAESETYQNATGAGNTTAAYTIPSADAGKKLRVVVTGVSPAVGTLTSTATNAVLTSPAISFIADATAAGIANVVKVSDTEVTLSSAATLTGNLTIPAGVTLTVNGTFTVNAGKTLTVDGTLKASSTAFTNNGTVAIGSSGTVAINGQVSSKGTWTNNGTVNVPQGGVFKAELFSTLSGSGITNVSGRFETDNATVSITGSIIVSSAAVFNKNLLELFGTTGSISLTNGSSVTVTYSNGAVVYTLNGMGTVRTPQFKVNANEQYVVATGATLDVYTGMSFTVNANGAVINNGTVTNHGIITNNGTFDSTGGTFINNGTVNGTITGV
ncbi:S-layer homology domain-containing protein [Cohnella herbarum]|uniref:SLH domain-containing protein n=1 Tax=Cohnella herbarum TaxID=2728023 RepID=A0A7Z2VLS1_9BACL|nr:InlB B-repeat-containing protein [Cohnella herbarum]QJD85646.1 hypothetical protein HH215_22320 [Cohnella herbarum]